MGTRVLAVALGPELVALVTSAAYAAADGAGGASSTGRGPVVVLAVLRLGAGAGHVGVVDADMLLQLLEGVVGALGQGVSRRRRACGWTAHGRWRAGWSTAGCGRGRSGGED